MKFDMSDVLVRWKLYRYHNRSHDGEIWLAFSTPSGLLLMEQNSRWPDDSKLLGEVRTRIFNEEFVHDIVPLQERSDQELQRMREQAEEHKRYRVELYRRYSLAQRIADLTGS
jgi:hypothetical protein